LVDKILLAKMQHQIT